MAVNKAALASAISFLVGLAGGGASAYLYCKNYYKNKADNDIQDMAEYYERRKKEGKKNDRPEHKEKDICVEQEEVKESKAQTEYEAISDIYRNKQTDEEPTAYNNYFGNDSNRSSGNKKSGKKKKKEVIEVVDESFWENPPKGYDTRFLIFYDADNVLYDEETESVIENIDTTVGNIANLDTDTPEEPIYILNNNLKTLYHITIEHMSYSEAGLDD